MLGRRWLDHGPSAHSSALHRVDEEPLLVLCSGLQEREMAARHDSTRRKLRNQGAAESPVQNNP